MTEEPMTVDAMDRETERLRGEKRRTMAALRACGGRGGDGPGGPCGDGVISALEGVVAPQPPPGRGEVRGPWRKHRLRMRFARSGPRAAPPLHRMQPPTGEVRR